MEKITLLHCGYMGAGIFRPLTHTVWILFCKILYRFWCTTVAIAFAKDWINGTTFNFVIS